ncbi:hypothetical protein [Flavobacterium hercynium]|uniref:Addiction module protein n=1 Tax=Flavobacterium hercynium TaxID=387094 RepID=A0A226GQG5_9FLAO|nr:hypothetical protein [Flavobacterium hercynium]OXA84289.1 hypothetical protein B0A66_21220 [Flavobacterium hercynium]SMP19922.1 hypothetical protein SAMN06265346_10694 [Flavobacterium hercynium]
METKELRRKLIKDFGQLIDDDSKLEILESFFDAINEDEKNSIVPDSHYNMVAEEREKYMSGEIQASSWEEAEQRLKNKYGF